MAAREEREIRRVRDGREDSVRDEIAVEAPLTIRLLVAGKATVAAITMRTPGADADLALGFLYAEGVIRGPQDLAADRLVEAPGAVTVALAPGVTPEPAALDRHFWTSSACGACGKRDLSNLTDCGRSRVRPAPPVPADVLLALPGRMREAQGGFGATGGLHAAALFSLAGDLLDLAEDVGRHNALDKLVGRALREGRLPLADRIVLVSGRASFELVQKAAAAGAPALAAISAPSTMAVETAVRGGLTLIAFLRPGGYNVYA